MWQAGSPSLIIWILMTVSSRVIEGVDQYVVERDNITFVCSAFASPLTSWFGPDGSGQQIRYTIQGQAIILDSVPQKNRLHVQIIPMVSYNISTLTIADAMKADAGNYACDDGSLFLYTFFLQVNDPNVTVYVTQGTQSVLQCPLTSVINNLQWFGPPGVIVYNSRGTTRLNINGLPAEFVSRLAVHPTTGALIINNTQRSDDNLYKCNVGGPINYVQLRVMVPPQNPLIINVTEDIGSGRTVVQAQEDNQISLVCQVRGGYPEPSARWFRGGTIRSEVPANNSSQQNADNTYDVTSTVIVTARRSEDRVTYVCQAEHRTWTSPQNASLELYLYLKPSKPVMSDPSNLPENAMLSSTCSTSGCRPAASIIWSGIGTASPATSIWDPATETFNVTSSYQKTVTRQDNGVQLQCTITHTALSSSLVTSRNITVWFPPISVSISNNTQVTAGDSLILRCTTGVSNPAANITWRNGTTLLSGGQNVDQIGEYGGKIRYQELSILTTRFMDGNIITCTADNDRITGDETINTSVLDVRFSPVMTVSIFPSMLVTEGEKDVMLRCTAWSKPISHFQWTKGNQTLPILEKMGSDGNQIDLSIATVSRTHAGIYSCLADNGVQGPLHERQKSIELLVQYPPDMNVTVSNVTTQDEKAMFLCSPHGYPDNYMFGLWQHSWPGFNGVLRSLASITINKTTTLELHNLTYEDSGIYTCQASNGIRIIGTEHEFMAKPVYLLVKSAPKIISIPENFKGSIGQSVPIQFDFYSNTEEKLRVTAFHSNSSEISYEGTTQTVHLDNLLVKSFFVSALGYRAILNIHITSEKDFGQYNIEVGNIIGSEVRGIHIIMQTDLIESTSSSLSVGAAIGIGVGGVAVGIIVTIIILTIRRGNNGEKTEMLP